MQEVIIYRNPLEAAIWHSLMDSEYTFPVIVSLVCFFGGLMLWQSIRDKVLPLKIRRSTKGYDSIFFGAMVAVGVFYKMV